MLDVTRATAALTREQKEKWERDGYLILPQFFGPDIVDPINALIEQLSHRSARGNEIAGRVVVDLLAGSAHKRMRLADAPDEAQDRPFSWRIAQTLSGVIGMSMFRTPRCHRASTTAFAMAGGAPTVADSPTPFAPIG